MKKWIVVILCIMAFSVGYANTDKDTSETSETDKKTESIIEEQKTREEKERKTCEVCGCYDDDVKNFPEATKFLRDKYMCPDCIEIYEKRQKVKQDEEEEEQDKEELIKDKQKIQEQYDNLKKENEQLKNDNAELQNKINTLNNEIEQLKNDNKTIRNKNERLQNEQQKTNNTDNTNTDNEVSHIQNEGIKEAYNNLPESVKKLFKDTDCTITEVTSIDDVYIPGFGNAAGVFRGGYSSYPQIEIVYNARYIQNVTYHEFGHLLDYGYNTEYESEDDEFMNIYYAERSNFKNDYNYEYAVSNSTEYFAEAFAEYMKNPQQLKDNTPRTYNYIVNTINNIE